MVKKQVCLHILDIPTNYGSCGRFDSTTNLDHNPKSRDLFQRKKHFLKYMHKTVIPYNSVYNSKKTRNNSKSISNWLNQEWLNNGRSTIDLQNILLSSKKWRKMCVYSKITLFIKFVMCLKKININILDG